MPARGQNTRALGLEASLWEAANRLRSNVDAAEYKHVVLGLIFLKYVSDVFAKRREQLAHLVADSGSAYFMPTEAAKQAVLESRDEYAAGQDCSDVG
jgi:type I restriction enzyme M protein